MGCARCEWYKSIDVRPWQRQGLLSPGTFFSQSWTCDGQSSGSIGVFVRDGSVTWAIDWARAVNRSSSPCISAGRAQSLVGAGHGSSARAVFSRLLSSTSVASVGLAGFAAIWPINRSWSRRAIAARKIRARLGSNRSGIEFPDKPRGMHWRTYERWREKHEAAVAKSWGGFWGSRFARRLGLG
jgi:hypothetical protein